MNRIIRMYSIFFLIIWNIVFCIASAVQNSEIEIEKDKATENRYLLKVGMNKADTTGRFIFEKICIGFEALHPKNLCQELYLNNVGEVLDMLKMGNIDLGVLPEDIVLNNSTFMKVLLPIYQKSFTFIAHFNSDVYRLSDLQKKKIGFSQNKLDVDSFKEETQFLSALDIKNKKNWFFYDSNEALVTQFCDHKVDVVLVLVSHPDRMIRELTTACDGTVLPISSQVINTIIKTTQSYGYYEINPYYWRMKKSISTVSTRALLVAKSEMPAILEAQIISNFWNEIKDSKSFKQVVSEIYMAFNQGKITLTKSGDGIIAKIKAIKADFSGNYLF